MQTGVLFPNNEMSQTYATGNLLLSYTDWTSRYVAPRACTPYSHKILYFGVCPIPIKYGGGDEEDVAAKGASGYVHTGVALRLVLPFTAAYTLPNSFNSILSFNCCIEYFRIVSAPYVDSNQA